MRRLPALVVPLFAVALAACSSGAAPGWTYAPAASATPVASGAASGAPSAGASSAAEPTPAAGTPQPTGSAPAGSVGPSAAAPSGGAGGSPTAGLTVTAPVGAAVTGWDPATLETAADAGFTLTFDNQDNQAPHNLVLQDAGSAPVAVQGDTAFFTGPGQRVYQVPALAAGAYTYICQVHPTTMVGTLTVQ
jgi:plastocyanin